MIGGKLSRREFLTAAGAAAVPYSQSRTEQKRLEIGLYITTQAAREYGSMNVNAIADFVTQPFRSFLDRELYIGPEGLIDVPAKARNDIESAFQWWAEQGEYADSNLLLFANSDVDWESSGRAYIGANTAVSVGARVGHFYVSVQHTLLHEIGHNLGLTHEHGATKNGSASVMVQSPWAINNDMSLEFSDSSQTFLQG